MQFTMEEAIEVLERTPLTLESMLSGLSEGWLQCNEGEGTWNASEVVDHLTEGEISNWMPRLAFLLAQGEGAVFPPFDRFAHLRKDADRSIEARLLEFKEARAASLAKLRSYAEREGLLERKGLHPQFGTVKARELLATWVVHDLTHIAQIARVIAKRYGEDVGPWKQYLSILK